MPYLGNTPTQQAFTPAVDFFSGNGSTTAFTLSRAVASVAQVEAVIENVVQNPNDAYTISGNTITFTSAPPTGSNNIYVRYTSPITQVIQPGNNTVGTAQLTSDLQNATYGMKNRIINGAMMIDQRNAGASVTVAAGVPYTLDRWRNVSAQASKFSIQRNAGSVTPPAGFTNYLGATSLSAYTPVASDVFSIDQYIEGLNCADLNWGTANAVAVTLSFWVRSSLTGTFGGALQNSAQTRSYPFSFTISTANTWEYKTVTIAGDTTGTWLTTNGIGMLVTFSLGAHSAFKTTANAWASGNYWSVTGATDVVATNGATFYITGVQLEKGSTATSFDYRPYGTELALCQRYAWVPDGNAGISGIGVNTTSISQRFAFPVQMRSAPTASIQTSGSYTATDDYLGDVTASTVTAVSYSVSQSTIRFTLGGFTGVTAGRFYAGLPGGAWTSRFLFSSEL